MNDTKRYTKKKNNNSSSKSKNKYVLYKKIPQPRVNKNVGNSAVHAKKSSASVDLKTKNMVKNLVTPCILNATVWSY